MLHFISISSNYIILAMCIIYTISSYTVYLPSSDETQERRMSRQEKFVYIFQIICFVMLFLKSQNIWVLGLCLCLLVFFKLLFVIYGFLYPDSSRILLNHTYFLLSVGFVILSRISLKDSMKQFVIVVISSVLCLFVPVIVRKAFWLKRLKWLYCLAGLLLLASVFVIGVSKNGSTNWISLGPVSIQPSEFVKICFVFFIASALSKKALRFRNMVAIAFFSALHVIILVTEKDLGAALLYFVLFIFLCYVATGRTIYIIGGAFGGALSSLMAYHFFSHVKTRVQAWLDPWSVIADKGYQITQSLFAIGSGSWFGLGLGQGNPKYLPVAKSDFIFSFIAEEFGMAFAICIILVYLALFIHFIKIAMDVEGSFYKLLAYGLSLGMILQVFLSVGGVTKFIPSTGVTLPLISSGGSSVVSTLILLSIMQGIFLIAYPEDPEEEEA